MENAMTFDEWMLTVAPKHKPSDDSVSLRILRECWKTSEAAERERCARKPLTFAQLDAAERDAQIKFCRKSGGSFEEEFARAIERAHGIGA